MTGAMHSHCGIRDCCFTTSALWQWRRLNAACHGSQRTAEKLRRGIEQVNRNWIVDSR
jgi:hypothetical protein